MSGLTVGNLKRFTPSVVADFSPNTVTGSFSPVQTATDKKVAQVVEKNRYLSPPRLGDKPLVTFKPSPSGSIDSVKTNFSVDSNGSLCGRFKELSALERPAILNVPEFKRKLVDEVTPLDQSANMSERRFVKARQK